MSSKKPILSEEDVTCPICLCLLVEPVRMPCQHCLCKKCFNNNIQQTSLQCPVCRTWIGNFARRSLQMNTLVDKKLWRSIQVNFKQQLKAQLLDSSVNSAKAPIRSEHTIEEIALPGEILREFEQQARKICSTPKVQAQKASDAELAATMQVTLDRSVPLTRAKGDNKASGKRTASTQRDEESCSKRHAASAHRPGSCSSSSSDNSNIENNNTIINCKNILSTKRRREMNTGSLSTSHNPASVPCTKDNNTSNDKSSGSSKCNSKKRSACLNDVGAGSSRSASIGSHDVDVVLAAMLSGLDKTSAASFMAEQRAAEAALRQEFEDSKLARRIQRQLSKLKVDRSSGSGEEYKLRSHMHTRDTSPVY